MAAVVMLSGAASAFAQTQGMDRRDARRDDRAGARAASGGSGVAIEPSK